MTDEEKAKLKEHIQNWKETSKVLDNLRNEQIRKSVTSEVLPMFDGMFKAALHLGKVRLSSGFVEMNRILEKSR